MLTFFLFWLNRTSIDPFIKNKLKRFTNGLTGNFYHANKEFAKFIMVVSFKFFSCVLKVQIKEIKIRRR